MESQIKIDELVKIIKNDGLVIIPTDTIYGFSCLPTSGKAINRIADLKQRVSKPYIILETDKDRLRDYFRYAFADKIFKEVINQKVWPGKLTIIADKCGKINYPFLSGINTIAIRYPDSEFIDCICSDLKSGIVSTSINLSGQNELNSISEIKDIWEDKVDYVWEDETESNNASLIISINSWTKSIEIVRDPNTQESKEILLKLDNIVKKCQ